VGNYVLTVQYEGTRYNGWQRQGNTENTIQGKLERILERMTGRPVEVHGAGRTDAGVHSLGQTANVHLDTRISPEEIRDYLNRYLPGDIGVLQVALAQPRFHARLWAGEKHYRYRILTGPVPDVFNARYQWRHEGALDVKNMQAAAVLLTGTHDFLGYSSLKKTKKSTVRTIRTIEIRTEGAELLLDFYGDGFLYHMVRILVGTLVEVGEGTRAPEAVAMPLETLDRTLAGPLAPAQGLTLQAVRYSGPILLEK
jgi:tRNA pseudouridine38-40 synthase